jgi:hypothetical protein
MAPPDRQAEIAKRAYAIWEREGCPKGRELEHWLKAEAELDKPAPPPPAPKRRRTRADRARRSQ